MKTVFVQRGVGKAGKTTTIRLLHDLLCAAHPDAEVRQVSKGRTEIRVVITIGPFKIGIESLGDPSALTNRLEPSLELFVRLQCDVIVCAARTRGDTTDAVRRLKHQGYQVIERLRSPVVGEEARAATNLAEARWMFEQIEEMMAPAPA